MAFFKPYGQQPNPANAGRAGRSEPSGRRPSGSRSSRPLQYHLFPLNAGTSRRKHLLNLELRYALPPGWEAMIFHDEGRVKINETPWSPAQNRLHLAGYGLGTTYSQGQPFKPPGAPPDPRPHQTRGGHPASGCRASTASEALPGNLGRHLAGRLPSGRMRRTDIHLGLLRNTVGIGDTNGPDPVINRRTDPQRMLSPVRHSNPSNGQGLGHAPCRITESLPHPAIRIRPPDGVNENPAEAG